MRAQVQVKWSGEGSTFIGTNPSGHQVTIDGDQQNGPSPMMLLLHAEAGCTGIDVVSILKKMQQPLEGLEIEVIADKSEGDYPRVWEKIHLIYTIKGNVLREKAEHAVSLSLEKYCSVGAMLKKTAVVTHEIKLI